MDLSTRSALWSRNSDRVFYTAIQSNANSIWSIRPDGTDRRKTTDNATLAGVFWR